MVDKVPKQVGCVS